MKTIRLIIIASIFLGINLPSWAVGPGSGTKTKYNVRIANCHASLVTVRYKLDSLMGEPTVAGSFKWEGNDCRLPSSTKIWLQITDGHGGKGYVKIDPVAPKANAGYGYNATGSPNWGSAICGFNGTRATRCLSPSNAKSLWKSGRVTDFVVVW